MDRASGRTAVFQISGRKFFDPATWSRFESETGFAIPAFPDGVSNALRRFQRLQHTPMQQLADWAEIGPGTRVCSVGGGWGYEEVVFFDRGADVTILDIDEYGVLRPLAQGGHVAYDSDAASIRNEHPEHAEAADRPLELLLGDFVEGLPQDRKFDVLYVSSLTPNDLRLGAMIRLRGGGRPALNGFLNRSIQLAGLLLGRRWRFFPPWEEPILPSLTQFAEDVVAPGGRLLIKYYACPPVTRSRWYVPAMQRQLRRHGFELVSVIRNEAVHQRHAILAVRLGTAEADAVVERLTLRGPVVRNLSVRDANPHEVREIFSRGRGGE